MIYLHALPMQFRGDSPVSVAAAMRYRDFLNRVPDEDLFFDGCVLGQTPIVASAADVGEPAQVFDSYLVFALSLGPRPDFGVDVGAPLVAFSNCSPLTLRKAETKKSTSWDFLPRACWRS